MSEETMSPTDASRGICQLNRFKTGSRPRLTNPVYYDGHVYAFGHDTRPITVHRFLVDMQGRVGTVEHLVQGIPRKHANGMLATCVYRGKVYVFYDWDQGGWKYSIRHKSNSAPHQGVWDGVDPRHPGDAEAGANTGIVAQYSNWTGTSPPDSLHATVFNDKIYLFYMNAREQIEFSTYDGKSWVQGKVITEKKLQPHYAVTTVLRKNVPYIVICAQEVDRRTVAILSFINSDHSIEYGKHVVPYGNDWVADNDHLSLANGSVREGFQDNTLQAFFTSSHNASFRQVRRVEINLATDALSQWTDTGIPSKGVDFHKPCDVVHVPVVEADGKSFRHFLTVLTQERSTEHFIACYASDRFRMVYEKTDVLVHSQEDAGAWILLGVVEGVPPFTRNGAPPDGATSSVSYGLSSTETVTVETTYETSIGLMAGSKGTIALSMEVKQSFAATNRLSRTVKTETSIPFHNTGPNEQGDQGYFILQRPHLSNRNYERRSFDSSKLIDKLHVTWVSGIDVTYDEYALARPPAGMQTRAKSSQLEFWERITGFPNYGETVRVRQLNSVRALAGRPPQSSGLSIENVQSSRVVGGAELVLKAGSTIEQLFQVTGTASFGFTLAQEVSTAITKNISAALGLPVGDGRRHELMVKPAWLLPEPEASFPRTERPYWIPDMYFRPNLVPWCLTWRVLTG